MACSKKVIMVNENRNQSVSYIYTGSVSNCALLVNSSNKLLSLCGFCLLEDNFCSLCSLYFGWFGARIVFQEFNG